MSSTIAPDLSTEMTAELLNNLTKHQILDICGYAMEQNKLFTNVRFFSSGIMVCVVGAFGLIGNALTCLTIKMMSRSMTLFNKLLLTLTLIDTVFILTGGAFMTRAAFGYVLCIRIQTGYLVSWFLLAFFLL